MFAGPYIGTHAGYQTGGGTFSSAPYTIMSFGDRITLPARSENFNSTSAFAGLHGGINFAIGSMMIAGVEGDWSYLGNKAEAASSGTVISQFDGITWVHRNNSVLETNWQGTLRGRLGFVTGSTLFYATGGVAFLDVDWSDVASSGPVSSPLRNQLKQSRSETLVGSAVGAGIETAVTPSFVIGGQYLYEDFGTFGSLPQGSVAGQAGKIGNLDVHKVRLGISYKFNWPMP